MSDLVEHSDNPFEIDGKKFGIEKITTKIQSPSKTVIEYQLLMFTEDNGWVELNKWDSDTLKEETPNRNWNPENLDDLAVETVKNKASFYA